MWLPSIQAVEGGAPGTVHRNTDGSSDLGVMQINTRWIPYLAGVSHWTPAVTTAELTNDPCVSIRAAGLIMTIYAAETHNDWMTAIGDYHSHTKPLNKSYQAMVWAAASRLDQRGAFLGADAAPATHTVRTIRAIPMACPTMRFASVSSLTQRADPALHCR